MDENGSVFVRTPDGPEPEVKVGEWLAGDPADGVRFYERKYASLAVEIDLLEHRITDSALPADEAKAAIGKLREQVDEPHCIGDLAVLRRRLDGLIETVDQQRAARKAEREAARAAARATREQLVEEAERLAESTQWKASGERFKQIVEEWRQAPHAERGYEQELWKRLSHARSTFEKRRRAWFAKRDQQRSEAVGVKEKIVKEAEALANSKDWGPTSTAFRSLMQRWKAAGPATREAEQELWTRFKAAQDTFFTARSAVYSERDAEQKANLEAKQKLADEAEALLPVKDLDAARAALRSIQDRWASIGHVPRADKQAVERRLQQVELAVRKAEDARWQKTNPEARARAEATIAQLTSSIAKLEAEREIAATSGRTADVEKAEAALEARRQWLAQAENALQEFS
ncbi:MAG TPA: DUF349 domain-containing protein [Actinomycetes bacterium]|nr:DUF349 domain-containing protein [Actinomycetes bacterium]